jgi:RNA polymerase sigma factor (sigma-70 family)
MAVSRVESTANNASRLLQQPGRDQKGVVAVTGFKNSALAQLTDQQVRFAPPARRQEQLARAEKLLSEIDPAKQYPYQFVCFRITEFRPESHADLLIPGGELMDDLRLMIQSLAFLTLDEISKTWNVSTKTVRRWNKLGLVGRKIPFNGRQQLAFEPSVVERFLTLHGDRVERGAKFSQLTAEEREDILRQAQSLLRITGGSLTEISRRIAERLNRSSETIRYTIKNFDRAHPDQALFPELTGPLDEETKQTIFTSYRRGIAVDTLAKRFQRTRTSMYRVINEVRAQRLLEQTLDYIPNPSFENPTKELEGEMLGPMPDAEEYEAKRHQMKAPKDVQAELAPLYEVPLLSKEQEQHLFRKMNYLKFKAASLRDQLCKAGGSEVDPSRVRIQTLKEIEDLQAEANAVKDLLINANMRLVVNIAKKHAPQADNFFELLSDGNMSLIRAVEKFDFGRGFKFSTYASWAIIKNFARSIPDEKHRRERFVTGHDDVFDIKPDNRSDEHELLASQERATRGVNRLLEYLEPRERDIVRMRAGLDSHAKGMTLEEIGKQFNITKERVRQLNARAMKKLRDIAKDKEMDMP